MMNIRLGLRSVFRRFSRPDPKPLILMYHRVADELVDPWGLVVSPSRFREQMHVLNRTRRPMPLTEFVHRLMARSLPADAVAVTFDDGYLDNLVAAKPILSSVGVPATVFLVTGYLDQPKEFWWDELARIILLARVSRRIELLIGGQEICFQLDCDAAEESIVWRAWSPPMSKRQQAFVAIWSICRSLDEEERGRVLAALRSSPGQDSLPPATSRSMNRAEARALVSDGLVTIGAHTVTHPVLTALSSEDRQNEINVSKAACEALIGGPVAGFAYPYGELDTALTTIMRSTGFQYACSTRSEPANAAADIMALPRYQVFNYEGDTFEQWLRSL
jgi:peptidoglycan/xylan/chitin deacetylase (PgdA/CDA1 family)